MRKTTNFKSNYYIKYSGRTLERQKLGGPVKVSRNVKNDPIMDFPKPMGSKLTCNTAGILNFKKKCIPRIFIFPFDFTLEQQ